MAGNASVPGASVTSRVLATLAAFDDTHRVLTLTELANRAGLPLSTAHRIVGELSAWGGVQRLPSGEYVLGRRIWDLGLLAPVQSGIREIASPYMHDLFAAIRSIVHLAERDGTRAHYLEHVAGQVAVPVLSRAGSRLPLHTTGVGKVLLAHAPPQVQAKVLASLERVTPYSIVQPGRLQAELRRVVRDGYAQTAEEMSLGAFSVAVPVFDGRGEIVAALGVVVPSLRGASTRLVPALRVAAQGITRGLASSASPD
jgi:DNA-binding IclR family transcriptional regulator